MKYLLDTDHLSILQRQIGENYNSLTKRMAQHSISDFAVSVATFHEQVVGSHAYINRARTLNQVKKSLAQTYRPTLMSSMKTMNL